MKQEPCIEHIYFTTYRSNKTLSTKDSTAIDILQQPTLKKEKTQVEEIGSQDYVVMLTPSPLPPPYKAQETSVAMETREKKRRKRGRRKAKSEMPPLQEEEEDEKLLLIPDSREDQGDAVITLSPERSHDTSCDQSSSSSADEGESEDVLPPPNSTREHSLQTSANNKGRCQGNPNRSQIPSP